MINECTCGINAHSLTGTCECEEGCSCECEVCECDNDYSGSTIDMWAADSNLPLVCACGGNCSCGQISSEVN